MMNNGGSGDPTSQLYTGRRQLVYSAQLFKAAETMHHIDELFLWQNRLFLQQFDTQAVEFWSLQSLLTGQVTIKLRAVDWQDASLPQNVLVNNQIANSAGNLLSKQQNFMMLSVNNLFSSHQAELLARYGLNYCFCDFLRSPFLLPPMPNATEQEIPTPLAVAAMLFFKRYPAQDEVSAINLIIRQSLAVATTRGLLLPARNSSSKLPAISGVSPPRQTRVQLSDLIPHRLEDANAMRSSNPFANAAVIADKRARRLYTAIDGRKNVREIATTIGMDSKEIYLALQFLLEHHRVQLYESGGQLVDEIAFIDTK